MTFFISCSVYFEEKNTRENFENIQKLNNWKIIIEKFVPASVFISKFN
jgi:hypothetical protein